jgi:hypothetical protein
MPKQEAQPESIDPAAALVARQEEIRTEASDKITKLEAERVRIWEERRPITKLLEKRNLLAQKIERAAKERPKLLDYAAEWEQLIDRVFESESLATLGPGRVAFDLSITSESHPHLANAHFAVQALDAFLARKEAELKMIDAELENAEKKSPDALKWLRPWRR